MHRVEGKVAIVTGGAKNIGLAISLRLAEEGAKVCVFDIDSSAGKETIDLIQAQGGEAFFVRSDVTQISDIARAANAVLKKYNHVDILVNNVGASKGITLDDIDENTFRDNIDTNLKSAVFCTKPVLLSMIEQCKGSVVFISSINALLGGFSEVIYSSAKGALGSLVKTLTGDYSKYGIRFNLVCPGSIPGDSECWRSRERNRPGVLARLSRLYPLGRYGEPIDVANAVLFLASDEAAWITGISLAVDGGITATGALPGGKWWENL